MKFKLELWLSLGIVILLCLVTGCGSVGNYVLEKKVVELRPALTNEFLLTNTITATNYESKIIGVLSTNESGMISVTNVIRPVQTISVSIQVVTNFVITPPVTYTNVQTSDGFDKSLQGLGNTAQNLGVPFASTAAAGILAILHVIFGIKNKRTKSKLTETQDALTQAKTVGSVLVDNFEELRKVALQIPAYQAHDEQVMKLVTKVQQAAGVHGDITTLVGQQTETTNKTI